MTVLPRWESVKSGAIGFSFRLHSLRTGYGTVSKQQHETDPIIGDAVGSQLRSLYQDFASEAVPDRFMQLIEKLEKLEEVEEQARARGGDGASAEQAAGPEDGS